MHSEESYVISDRYIAEFGRHQINRRDAGCNEVVPFYFSPLFAIRPRVRLPGPKDGLSGYFNALGAIEPHFDARVHGIGHIT